MATLIKNRFQTIAIVLLVSFAIPILPTPYSTIPDQYSEKVDSKEFLTGFEAEPLNEIESFEKFYNAHSATNFGYTIDFSVNVYLIESYSFSHSIPNYLSQPPPYLS